MKNRSLSFRLVVSFGVVTALAVGAGACGDDDDPAGGDETTTTTALSDDGGNSDGAGEAETETAGAIAGFTLPNLTVAAGDEISIDNTDGTGHTFTSADDAFDTGTIDAGQTVTFVAPSEPGDYPIFCRIHPTMEGVLTVQ